MRSLTPFGSARLHTAVGHYGAVLGHMVNSGSTLSRSSTYGGIGINFRAAGYADLGTPYTPAPFSHTPTCMQPVHFEASLWIVAFRNMSTPPRNNGPLRTRPPQLGTAQQGRLSLHP